MRVAVPTEVMNHEYRVAITPAGVHELVARGHEIIVQAGAGLGSAITDEEYRAAGVRIAYVRVGFSSDYRECPPASPIFSGARANGIFQLGTKGTEVHPALAPQPQDFDIVKHRVSPFYATSLEAILRANGVERIVMCGVSTNGVVHSGAREAHDRDYEVVILEDCCAGVTPDEHMHAVACLGRYGSIVQSTDFDWTA